MDGNAEIAAIYDAIYGGREDVEFWRTMAAAGGGAVLELGCGTGRTLLPLAQAGIEVTGLDLAAHMLERCRAKLELEPQQVRCRVELVLDDMTSFDLGRRFALITIPFAGFQHLRTVEEQLACLDRCHRHLLPRGRLVLDLPNPDPAPASHAREQEPTEGEAAARVIDWTGGRRVRWWDTIVAYDRLMQFSQYELTYEIIEADGTTRRLSEAFGLRYVFRYELEHLLIRAGFHIITLFGDYDCSPFGEASPALIVVAEKGDG